MTKQSVKALSSDLLEYRDGKRRSGTTVRAVYMRWRSEQTPPWPDRCDNERCQFHTGPLVWLRKPLKTILEHRNGVNTDNEPQNLRLLCPNCDSQNTETRGGANKGRVTKSAGGFAIARTNGLQDHTLRAKGGQFRTVGAEAQPAKATSHTQRQEKK